MPFCSDFFYLSTRFLSVLTIESSARTIWLTSLSNLFPSFWLFLVLFWMLWMLVTAPKPCHVPHLSRITTSRTIFLERPFRVSKEWVKSWSHTSSLITYDKIFIIKLLAVRPEKVKRGKKRKKSRKTIVATSVNGYVWKLAPIFPREGFLFNLLLS